MAAAKAKTKATPSMAAKAAPKKGTWGGRRANAGRKPLDPKRLNVPHRARPPHDPKQPVYGSIRRAKGLPSLRTPRIVENLLRCATTYADGEDFRVIHLSTDAEHLHVIVEATSKKALQSGMQSLAIRLARNVNILLARQGELWDDRFLHRPIESAHAMRDTLREFFPRTHSEGIGSPLTVIAQKGWSELLGS